MSTNKKKDLVTFPGLGEKGVRVDEIAVAGKHYKIDPPYEGIIGVDFRFELDHENHTAKVIPPEG